MHKAIALLAGFLAVTASTLAADEKPAPKTSPADPMASCPMHAQHMAAAKEGSVTADGSAEHGQHVDARHDTLGMSHERSTHSFRLFADGGAIELRASDPADEATATAIRTHLQEITPQFGKGDFSTPRFVHGYTPDGVAELQRLKSEISYRYERLAAGGRIRMRTKSPEALAAIHAFLRFQVTEHRSADSGKVEEDKAEE